ncbi:methyltransferase family protein [Lysobacter korlensis]|uniref:Methyltransferase family protein n=1 Tax=Lysobacter korlensis TaxID=553636 RepID=A0ABV6RN28_9GAMM
MSTGTRTLVRNIPLPEANLLAIALGAMLQRLLPLRVPGVPAARRVAGAALICIGTGVAAAAVASAKDVELADADRLVVTGVYARSRNPMYVGWALLHAGFGVAAGSGWVLVTLLAASGRVHREVLAEERVLSSRFPVEYSSYAATAPRYVPRLGRLSLGRVLPGRTEEPGPEPPATGTRVP